MTSPRYQLVVQRRATTLSDFDAIVALEEALRVQLGDSAEVDGHDFGSGEANIFILTDDPQLVFNAILPTIRATQGIRAAYREITGDAFTLLYPPGLKLFTVA